VTGVAGSKSSACSQDVALRAQRSFAPEALHLLHSYYDLMCQSQSLSPTSLCRLAGQSSQLGPPTAGLRDLPDVTCANLSPDAWTHTPAASGVLLPVSSPRASAFPKAVSGRRSANTHATTSARRTISELQSFLYVQASRFASHPGRSHRCLFRHGSRDIYFRAPCVLLPPHTSDMLAVRFRAIDGRGLSPH
jgi:hypothetical protein